MADEAFALSPISARAAQPREEDYDAIREAFMETSRGRWFLGEYAKRNRNADTGMVLDAVARIEETLAAQRQADADAGLAEALAAIRSAVDAAQMSATEAFDSLALDQKLAPVRKGARVIREIAWRLREIGTDGRICDLIDSQVAVIEAGAAEISSDEVKAALDAAFAAIGASLTEFTKPAAASSPVAEAAVPSSSAAAEATSGEPSLQADEVQGSQEASAVAEAVNAAPSEAMAAAPVTEAAPSEAAVVETVGVETAGSETVVAEVGFAESSADETLSDETALATPALPESETALAETDPADEAQIADDAAADAHNDAMLDLIAMEMGADDPFEIDETATMIAEEAHIMEQAPPEDEIFAQAPELVTVPAEQPAAPSLAAEPAPDPAPQPALEVSLGSTIIANGMVRRPSPANDPLAPIRRMTQAEKIAFFS